MSDKIHIEDKELLDEIRQLNNRMVELDNFRTAAQEEYIRQVVECNKYKIKVHDKLIELYPMPKEGEYSIDLTTGEVTRVDSN